MEKTISDKVPETELCYLEIEGPVAIITISRKEVFNALNAQLISELIDLIGWTSSRSVAKNNSLKDSNETPYFRALVLKSEGKHFCAGADVNMMNRTLRREARHTACSNRSICVQENRQFSI